MLAGLEEPSGGEIVLNNTLVSAGKVGIIVPPGQRDAGMVFQSYALWPHMTIFQNVAWPLKVKSWTADKRRERVREALTFLNIEDYAERYPGEISGGQQQRVAIARTIASRPKFLFFDEPLSNGDAHRITARASSHRRHQRLRNP